MDRGDENLGREFLADRKAGAGDGADQIPSAGKLPHPGVFPESQILQAVTGWPAHLADPEITACLDLVEGRGNSVAGRICGLNRHPR